MKVRTDYVTNSSSSSFVLQFKNKTEMKELIEQIRNEVGDVTARLIQENIEQNIVGKREALFNIGNDISIHRLAYMLGIDEYWKYYSFKEMRDPTKGIGKKIDAMRKEEVKRIGKMLNPKCIIVHMSVSDDTPELGRVEYYILPEHKNTIHCENHH